MFTIYQSRPVECKAYQFKGDTINCPGVTVREGKPVVVTTSGNTIQVNVGDWIIQEADTVHHYACTDDVFQKRWRMKPPRDFNKNDVHPHYWFSVLSESETGVSLECACGEIYRLDRTEWENILAGTPPTKREFYHIRMEESPQKN